LLFHCGLCAVVHFFTMVFSEIESKKRSGFKRMIPTTKESFSLVNGWTWGNNEIHERSYDLNGRLISLSPPNSQQQTNLPECVFIHECTFR